MAYLWDKNKISPAGRAGLGVAIRLAEKVFFNIEANANVMSDKFNSKKAGNADWQFNALAGFTFKFGKPSRTTEPVYYEPTPTPPPAPAPVNGTCSGCRRGKTNDTECILQNQFG